MFTGIALLFSGVALHTCAGSTLGDLLARDVRCLARCRLLVLAPLLVAGPVALALAARGNYQLYRGLLPRPVLGLPMEAFAVLTVVPPAVAAVGLLVASAVLRRRRGGGGGGGGGDGDLPPPPDPDGPDGWAVFEREFWAYVAAQRERPLVLVR